VVAFSFLVGLGRFLASFSFLACLRCFASSFLRAVIALRFALRSAIVSSVTGI